MGGEDAAAQAMKTAVVIPTKNNIATIEKCLASLVPYYEQGYISEIVVVDAHSTDGTLEVLKRFPAKLIMADGKSDHYTYDYAYYARDLGWRATKAEMVLFVDNDAYLGENFFPAIYDSLTDAIGIVGAQERAVVTNGTSRTIGEWWLYHSSKLRSLIDDDPASWSWFQRLYHRIAWNGEKQVTTSGPCYLVRRTCLEAVNGFECPQGSADILLSRRIIEEGWKATWWLDSPLYHHPPRSLEHLINQRRLWGKIDAAMHRGSLSYSQRALLTISRLGTPLVGLWLALRFKNPRHLWLFPMAQYAWIYGYITSRTTMT